VSASTTVTLSGFSPSTALRPALESPASASFDKVPRALTSPPPCLVFLLGNNDSRATPITRTASHR